MAPERLPLPAGVIHRVLKDRRTGREIHARPVSQEVPLAARLTEEREFDVIERALEVDEARSINSLPPAREFIRATAAEAQAVMRAKLAELGFEMEIV